jgi:phage-related minor tail protein
MDVEHFCGIVYEAVLSALDNEMGITFGDGQRVAQAAEEAARGVLVEIEEGQSCTATE